jgi:hypothetical protein
MALLSKAGSLGLRLSAAISLVSNRYCIDRAGEKHESFAMKIVDLRTFVVGNRRRALAAAISCSSS